MWYIDEYLINEFFSTLNMTYHNEMFQAQLLMDR